MKKSFWLVSCVASIFFLVGYCFAGGIEEGVSQKQSVQDPIKSFFENKKVEYLLSFTTGFDNNVWLDSRRISDGFAQVYFKPKLTSSLSEHTDGILSYELLSVIYMGESDANFIENALNAGLDHKLNENVNFLANYRFGVTEYLNSGSDDFLDHAIEFKLKQKLANKYYHSLLYEFMFKDYKQRKTRLSETEDTDKERSDKRNTVEYEIGKYFAHDLIKAGFQYYFNDSNESYLKYYDYDSYQPEISLTHFFNKKIFSYTSFSYQLRNYRSRTLSEDVDSKEKDKTGIGTLGLYYIFKKGLTTGITYTYRQNYSNEPAERYSGSLISLNAYLKF